MKSAVLNEVLHEQYTPIDIDAFSRDLESPEVLFTVKHTQTTRSIERIPDNDERPFYLPYARILEADPLKYDIATGLGTLGLIALRAADLRATPPTLQRSYAAALLDYTELLRNRSRMLRVPGQLESPNFQALYPKTELKWARQYAGELGGLRDLLVGTPLFGEVEKIRANSYVAVHRLQMGRDKKASTTEVLLNRAGKPVVVGVPKGFAQQRRPVAQ